MSRRLAYATLRAMNDYRAIRRGHVGQRIGRRLLGRVFGGLMRGLFR